MRRSFGADFKAREAFGFDPSSDIEKGLRGVCGVD